MLRFFERTGCIVRAVARAKPRDRNRRQPRLLPIDALDVVLRAKDVNDPERRDAFEKAVL